MVYNEGKVVSFRAGFSTLLKPLRQLPRLRKHLSNTWQCNRRLNCRVRSCQRNRNSRSHMPMNTSPSIVAAELAALLLNWQR